VVAVVATTITIIVAIVMCIAFVAA